MEIGLACTRNCIASYQWCRAARRSLALCRRQRAESERAGMTKSREDPTDVPADCVSYHRHPNCDWSRDEIPHWHRVGSDDSYKPFKSRGRKTGKGRDLSFTARESACSCCLLEHTCVLNHGLDAWTDGNSRKLQWLFAPARPVSGQRRSWVPVPVVQLQCNQSFWVLFSRPRAARIRAILQRWVGGRPRGTQLKVKMLRQVSKQH